jgi:hypothetical protein
MGLMGIGEFARLSRLSRRRCACTTSWDCCRLPASTWTLATAGMPAGQYEVAA